MLKSYDPSTGRLLTTWHVDSQQLLARKIKQVDVGFKEWSRVQLSARVAAINYLAEILSNQQDYFASLIAITMGKPITAAKKEVQKCALVLRHYANPEFLTPVAIASSYQESYEVLQPMGAIFTVMPWNYPLWQVIRVLAPNLLLGNAILLAHAPNVHAVALALEQAMIKAGLPQGLLTVVRPDYSHSQAILLAPEIIGLAFTGSDKVGASLAAMAGAALKPSTLECGGSDPYIVLADADLIAAAKTIIAMRMNNSGQVCVSAKRVIVIAEIYDQFIELLYDLLLGIKFAEPLSSDTEYGPMARSDIRAEVHSQVQQSIAAGANCLLGGSFDEMAPGYYYPATMLTGVTPDMPAFVEEVFGPVLAVTKADSIEQAIILANQHKYGLGAAVFSQDLDLAQDIAKQINVGTCMINAGVSSDPCLPFGGIGRSGYGRELGQEGIRAFANIKIIGWSC